MPIPAYVICSQSGAEDASTRQVSLFHVVETVKVVKGGASHRDLHQHAMPVHLTAAWIREPGRDSPEDEFEYQITIAFPGDDEESAIEKGTFSFTKPIWRIRTQGRLALFPGVGILRFIARLRKVGSEKWIEQSYPLVVSEVAQTDTSER